MNEKMKGLKIRTFVDGTVLYIFLKVDSQFSIFHWILFIIYLGNILVQENH